MSFTVHTSLALFQEMDIPGSRKSKKGKRGLDREEFQTFYKRLTRRPEIEELFLEWE